MNLSFRQLSLSVIFSFSLSMDDVNPETDVSIASFSAMSVFIEVWSISIVGINSSSFLLD